MIIITNLFKEVAIMPLQDLPDETVPWQEINEIITANFNNIVGEGRSTETVMGAYAAIAAISPTGNALSDEIDIFNPPAGLTACVPGANSGAAFAAILAYAKTNGKGIYVPNASAPPLVNAIDLSGCKGVTIRSRSQKCSGLKLNSGQNNDFITLFGTSNDADGCGVHDIKLDCNGAQVGNNAAIRINGIHIGTKFENLYLYNGYTGIAINGDEGTNTYRWIYQFDNVCITGMAGYGIDGIGSDNSFERFVVGPTKLHNVKANGANVRMGNFKCMGSKEESGFYVSGSRLQMVNIDCQESFMHGMEINGSYDLTINNLNCDNNGLDWPAYIISGDATTSIKAVRDSYGLHMTNVENSTIQGYNFSNRNTLYRYGLGAYYANSGSKGLKVQVNHETNPYAYSIDDSNGGIDFMEQKNSTLWLTADYTLTSADIGKMIVVNSTNPVVVTVPTVAIDPSIKNGKPVSTRIIRRGTGTVSIASAASISSISGHKFISTQYGMMELSRDTSANDKWFLNGNLAIS